MKRKYLLFILLKLSYWGEIKSMKNNRALLFFFCSHLLLSDINIKKCTISSDMSETLVIA